MSVADVSTMRAPEDTETEMQQSTTPLEPGTAVSPPSTLTILFGSEMGNAEIVADKLAETLIEHGVHAECQELNDQPVEELDDMGVVLIVCSTCGEGDMPYSAEQFWKRLNAADAPRLSNLRYAVLALGDSGYTYFCEAGVQLDARLAELGAIRIADRVDCDVNYAIPSDEWIAARVGQLASAPADAEAATGTEDAPSQATAPSVPLSAGASAPSAWTRDHPFEARLVTSRLLSDARSAKEIRHYELDLSGSGIDYRPGDSLAIVPENDPVAVENFLEAAGVPEDELLDGESFRHLAEHRWELRFPSIALLNTVARRAPDSDLARTLSADDHAAGEEWIRTHGVCETLRELASPLSAPEVGALMSPIRYRAYSIASSPRTHPQIAHLTVATQRNPVGAALPSGVGSGFLADRVEPGDVIRVFPLPNRSFRLPDDPVTPIIMVGPGVGVAPFRSFLADRADGAEHGPAWLFYGDQHEDTDFIYRSDWDRFLADGVLTRFDTAFSRDQAQKVYVQDRIREHASEIVEWLRDGAFFYICGDGKRMAADVDDVLHEIAAAELGAAAGTDLMEQLHREKRYLRDVY